MCEKYKLPWHRDIVPVSLGVKSVRLAKATFEKADFLTKAIKSEFYRSELHKSSSGTEQLILSLQPIEPSRLASSTQNKRGLENRINSKSNYFLAPFTVLHFVPLIFYWHKSPSTHLICVLYVDEKQCKWIDGVKKRNQMNAREL